MAGGEGLFVSIDNWLGRCRVLRAFSFFASWESIVVDGERTSYTVKNNMLYRLQPLAIRI